MEKLEIYRDEVARLHGVVGTMRKRCITLVMCLPVAFVLGALAVILTTELAYP